MFKFLDENQLFSSIFTVPIAIFFITIIKYLISQHPGPKSNLPPSPSKLPIIGNLHNLGSHPHRALYHMSRRLGPLMLLHFGSAKVLVLSSAEAAKEVMKTHDLIFANRPETMSSQKLLYNAKDVAFAPYGEYWRQIKSISVLHLLNNRKIKSFRVVREEEITLMVEKIKDASFSGSLINLSEIFMTLTHDVVCRAALGRKHDEGESGAKFSRLLSEFVELLGDFFVGDYIPWLAWVSKFNGLEAKLDKVAKELDEFLEGVVEEHMAQQKSGDGEEHNDFVDVLVWIHKGNLAGIEIDRTSIKAVILDMFAAGTDTTMTSLEWAMTELLRHPTVMKKLQKEVREIAGEKPDIIKEEDLEKMTYLKTVIKETLRLHPPVPLLVPRVAIQDVDFMGYNIPRGTQVIVNAWAIGRDPGLWEQPEEFVPERFLERKNRHIDVKGHDFELIPFGSGRRGCPGIQFAMTINELCLANLVNKFDWSLCGEAKENGLDMGESVGIAIHRKIPFFATANYKC